MPNAINIQTGNRQESPLDKIVKGLAIARDGFGIAVDLKKLIGTDPNEALAKEKLKAAERENRGVVTKAQLLDKGWAPVEEPPAPPVVLAPPGSPTQGPAISPVVAADPSKSPMTEGPRRFSKRNTQRLRVVDENGNETEGIYGRVDELKDLEKSETDLRKEHEGLETTKNTKLIKQFGDKALASIASKNGLGDVAGITAFARLIDPQTGVKDQEFNNIARSSGVYSTLANISDFISKGQRIPDPVRKDFVRQVNLLTQAQMNIQKREDQRFEGIAKDRGFEKLANEIETFWDAKQEKKSTGNEPEAVSAKRPSGTTSAAKQLSGEDRQALDWARANPNDKRAALILQRLGV